MPGDAVEVQKLEALNRIANALVQILEEMKRMNENRK